MIERKVVSNEAAATLTISNGDEIVIEWTLHRVALRYRRAASHEEAAMFMAPAVAAGLGETLCQLAREKAPLAPTPEQPESTGKTEKESG